MREPRISADLESWSGDSLELYARILTSLAGQLGVMNDFYMPLIDVARMLDGKSTNERLRGGE